MIRKLRIKFISLALIAVLSVLVIIMGAINVLNYKSVVDSADHVLELLVENGGTFNGLIWHDPKENSSDGSNPATQNSSSGTMTTEEVREKSRLFHAKLREYGLSAETPFETRYFSATVKKNGKMTDVNTGKVAVLSTSEAKKLIRRAYRSDKTSAFIGDYRYKKAKTDSGTLVVFVDCGKTLGNFRDFRNSSIMVSAFGFAIVALLVYFFSGLITKPAAESYDKQRRFITDAGHEIKTPLTIIEADASVIEMDSGPNEWLDDIKVQTKRLTNLTNELVYLSKMDEQNRENVTMIDFPLSDLVTETANSFESRAKVAGKDLEMAVDPMISMHGDEESIRKLVSILLDNALKYSDDNGKIKLSLSGKGSYIKLSVYNTVEKIEKKDLSRIFDRFYRADESRNSESGGHGIGLSIAQAIVKMHGGRISAVSPDGKSLTITAYLPAPQRSRSSDQQ
jgi:two-component system sensor histidine kinase CiaH